MTPAEPVWFNPLTNLVALLIGAALSYFVTWTFERRKEKREQKAHAFGLVFALQNICNDLIQLTNLVRDVAITRTDEFKAGVKLWQLMPISFGWDREVNVRPAELALLADTKDNDLVNSVQEAASAHRIYTRAAIRIGELKVQLAEVASATASNGDSVSFESDGPERARLTPIISQLEGLSEKLSDDLGEATHRAMECARAVPSKLKDHYNFDHLVGLNFISLTDDEEG